MSVLPILQEFPDRFESERLLIRAPQPGDGAEVHAAISESLDELCGAPGTTGDHGIREIDR